MSSFRHELTDAQWSRLETALPPRRRDPERKDDHLVINGIFAPPGLSSRRLRCAVFCRLPSARRPANRSGRPSADPQGSRRRAYAEQKWNLPRCRTVNSGQAGP